MQIGLILTHLYQFKHDIEILECDNDKYLDPAECFNADCILQGKHFPANRMQIGSTEAKLWPFKHSIVAHSNVIIEQ